MGFRGGALFFVGFGVLEGTEPADFGPDERDGEDGEEGADAAEDDGAGGAEEVGGETGFPAAEFVAGADEDVVDGGDAAAHFVGGENLHQRVADDDADVVEHAGEREHREG